MAKRELSIPVGFVEEMAAMQLIIRKEFYQLGISDEEGDDVLAWAIGEDFPKLDFGEWPERIFRKFGKRYELNKKKSLPIQQWGELFRFVAVQWREHHPIFIIPPTPNHQKGGMFSGQETKIVIPKRGAPIPGLPAKKH
jgi:hypothetical protein